MSDQQQQVPSTLINVKRVRKDQDQSGREKLVLTFGTDKDGNNALDALIDALETYRGRQVNFDIRVEQKTAQNGSTFDTAFVIVKEMIPKGATPAGTRAEFTPKTSSRVENIKARTNSIRKDFGG